MAFLFWGQAGSGHLLALLLVQSWAGSALASQRGELSGPSSIYYLHIPRTAGTSFITDAKKSLKTAQNALRLHLDMIDKEGCYGWRTELPRVTKVAMMVREPRSHVLSQYLMCGEGPVNVMTTVPRAEHDGFTYWLTRWRELQDKKSVAGDFSRGIGSKKQQSVQLRVTYSTLPFHCYNPMNLQTQHLTCENPFTYPEAQDAEKAIANMKESWFVGVSEAYQESICLFNEKVYGKLPSYCDCKNATAWKSFQQSHTAYHEKNVKTSSLLEQPPKVLEMIDRMTSADRALYQAAQERFVREMQELESKYSKTVLCDKDEFLEGGNKESLYKLNFADGPPPGWRP
mmetsp:Transcript_68494/g.155212  ORF Transcript_68494/g.155212 Transcript_68494/m.155212 type:complete len:343 (-) Transcript_68494:75-1103(-)